MPCYFSLFQLQLPRAQQALGPLSFLQSGSEQFLNRENDARGWPTAVLILPSIFILGGNPPSWSISLHHLASCWPGRGCGVLHLDCAVWSDVCVCAEFMSIQPPSILPLTCFPPLHPCHLIWGQGRLGCPDNPSMNVGQRVGLCLRHSARGQTAGSWPQPSCAYSQIHTHSDKGPKGVCTHTLAWIDELPHTSKTAPMTTSRMWKTHKWRWAEIKWLGN